MDELTLDNKKYLSSKHAAKVTGYAKDYVGQLCREGRVEARLVGRNWYVLEASILEHRFGAEEKEENEPEIAATHVQETWEVPRYSSEPVKIVPTMAEKPAFIAPEPTPEPEIEEVDESPRVLEDMQAAWKEWFETKSAPNTTISEPDPANTSEYQYASSPEEETPEEEVTISINRSYTPEYSPAEPEESEYESVRIDRHYRANEVSHSSNKRGFSDVVPMGYEVNTRRSAKKAGLIPNKAKAEGATTGVVVMKAVFLSIAVVAVAATVLGSGLVDKYTENSTASAITSFITGTKEVSK